MSHQKSKSTLIKVSIVFVSVVALLISTAWFVYSDKTTPPRFNAEQFADTNLQNAVDTIAQATVEGGAPGAVVLIRRGGKDYIAAAGVANKRTQQKMPTDTPLRIGSISKVYTATVILKLANAGKLTLDDPIAQYLSQDTIQGLINAKDATIKQLLMHTAGIPDYYDLRSYLTQDWTQPITLERTLPVAKRGSSNFTAGEKFEYSNMGYILLGKIAEQASGRDFASLIDEMIVQPLNLKHTYYNVKHPVKNGIHGYGSYFRPWADTYDWWEHSGPDGGIMATASETAQLLEALTFEYGSFNTTGSQMLKNLIPSEPRQKQGLGLLTLTNKAGDRLIGHTGDVFGYQTIAFSIPEKDAVMVAQVNCDCTQLTMSMIRNTFQAIKATSLKQTQQPMKRDLKDILN